MTVFITGFPYLERPSIYWDGAQILESEFYEADQYQCLYCIVLPKVVGSHPL